MHPAFAPTSTPAHTLDLVQAKGFGDWVKKQDKALATLCEGLGFKGEAGRLVVAPAADGGIAKVVYGVPEGTESFWLTPLPNLLPPGDYAIGHCPQGADLTNLMTGWADGSYRFTRYKDNKEPRRRFALPKLADADEIERHAAAIDWLRDLVNTPPADMGPEALAAEAEKLAREFNADSTTTAGKDLESGYPLVHAVGKGAEQAPRFVEIMWGDPEAPHVAIVGKGVCFDTGGLNLKGGDNMRLMKKDMGGAAHALALARLVMAADLPVRLHCYVPIVENAIGPKAFRPSDILKSRKGLTVEIEDTDAEGRLILADALARASEYDPELLIDFATLTGAARVALGPDLAPLYTDDDALAADFAAAAKSTGDPVWRMPLWPGYEAGLKSPIADLKNLGDGPMGGSITAALFLKQFVTAPSWAHFDIWAWRPARYGRVAQAAPCGLRAAWGVLKKRYGAA